MSFTAGWIMTYVLAISGLFALLHHCDHTSVTSNYTISQCH